MLNMWALLDAPGAKHSSIWAISKVLANHQPSELCSPRWCSTIGVDWGGSPCARSPQNKSGDAHAFISFYHILPTPNLGLPHQYFWQVYASVLDKLIHSCSNSEQRLVYSFSLSCQAKLNIYHKRTTRRSLNCVLIAGFTLTSHVAEKQYHFRLQGAYHLAARWIAKVAYCMKIFMFRK